MNPVSKNIYEIIKENNKDIINLIVMFFSEYKGSETPEELEKKLNIFKEYNDNMDIKAEYPTVFFDQFERNSRKINGWLNSEEIKTPMPSLSHSEKVKKAYISFLTFKIYASQKKAEEIKLEFENESFFINEKLTLYKLQTNPDIKFKIVLDKQENLSEIKFAYSAYSGVQKFLQQDVFRKENPNIEKTLKRINESKINMKNILLKDNNEIKKINDVIELEKLTCDTSMINDFINAHNLFNTDDLRKLIEFEIPKKLEITPKVKKENFFQKIKNKFK